MIWIPITVAAAALQVARNAAQRSIMGGAGPWGATLVRFLFGLPFATVFAAAGWLLTPGASAHPTPIFWLACFAGAGLQIAATAALLTAMPRSTFALGTAMQQSGLPFALVWGALFFGAHIGPVTSAGGLTASAGLAILTSPCRTGLVVQGIQVVGLTSYLAWRNPESLKAVLAAWRQSLGSGFCGAAASGLWFTAMALSPVGPVRAVGVVEMPIAAIAGRRLFKERLTPLQLLAGVVTAVGVAMA